MALFNLARMTVLSSGTGTITLNAAVSGFLTFDQAGCSTASVGQFVSYAINDTTATEIGTGTYVSSSKTLTRGSSYSTNSNNAIAMSNTAQVFITPRAADMAGQITISVFTSSGVFTTPANSTPTTVYKYTAIGGGGGGGGSDVIASSGTGGGGGAGALMQGIITSLTPSTTVTIVPGAGGIGGVSTGTFGGSGGATTIAGNFTTISAGGGTGGGGSEAAGVGGSGGTIGTGVYLVAASGANGNWGANAGSSTPVSGAGAAAPLFGAPGPGRTLGTGIAATGYGSGGGGAAGVAGGGAGSAGVVILEYIL